MRLSKIDPSNWQDHAHIGPQDDCLYLREYTSGRGYAFSETNQLILNLKKSPSRRGHAEWRYKTAAISQCARELKAALNPAWLQRAVLVPVPPSKKLDDPGYDDRMRKVCELIGPGGGVRDLVVQRQSTRASHECAEGERITVQELKDLYTIDESLAQPVPACIGILDDVLTAGTHFRAMSDILSARFPGVAITGLFVARRVFAQDPSAPGG